LAWKEIARALVPPIVDIAVDLASSAATPSSINPLETFDEDVRKAETAALKEIETLTSNLGSGPTPIKTITPEVPAPIMPKTQTLPTREKKIPPGKKRLLDAMKDLSAAEEHLIHKWPEMAREIRSHRKKIEDDVL